ncbi:MAG: DUF4145 domain-containing protein [Pannonibacter sp.]
MKSVIPTITATAFNCPHCQAFAAQHWFSVHVEALGMGKVPTVSSQEIIDIIKFTNSKGSSPSIIANEEDATTEKGRPYFDVNSRVTSYEALNISTSRCFNCAEIAIWCADKLIYPRMDYAVPANPDMPDDIRRDYDEASKILMQSPRGSAALIRLAIQKLCKFLGESGENINSDIANLVKSGLNIQVQQALDVVRVIGNNAVHPGQIDLRDDHATAASLFKLINLIVEKTISEPKHVAEIYDSLPESAVRAIEKRDGSR